MLCQQRSPAYDSMEEEVKGKQGQESPKGFLWGKEQGSVIRPRNNCLGKCLLTPTSISTPLSSTLPGGYDGSVAPSLRA